jgi:protein CpxP
MKKIILLAAFIIGSALAALAQGGQMAQKSPEQRADHMTKMLTKRLGLSPDQSQQIHGIYLSQATRLDSIKANVSPDKKTNRMTARTVVLSTHEHVMAILNDTQKKQFADIEAMAKQRKMAKKDTIGAEQ